MTRTLRDLNRDNGPLWWNRIELAKRRLVSSLIGLKLPVRIKVHEDTERGLACDVLQLIEPWRAEFGDERQDYAQALSAYHASGAPADWSQRFVSVYANIQPWEDWAKTWAHYLHLVDTLDTAYSFVFDAWNVALDC